MASPSSRRPDRTAPRTPRISYVSAAVGEDSPSQDPPSLSQTYAFDWSAARGEKEPPYGPNPSQLARRKARQSNSNGDVRNGTGTSAKARVVRKTSWITRALNYPSQLWFELTLLPQEAPLPPPKVLGRGLGLTAHILNICVCYAAVPSKSGGGLDDVGEGWADMRDEMRFTDAVEESGFGFMWFLGWILWLVSVANVLWVFTRFRTYTFYRRSANERLNSPNAKMIKEDLSRLHKPEQSFISWLLGLIGRQIRDSWRFLIGSKVKNDDLQDTSSKVHQLDKWDPPEMEMAFLTVYSPIHSMLYTILGWNNWMRVPVIMTSLSALLYAFVLWFEQAIKDERLIQGEVMHEYNEGFVNPRLNVVRKDACVMTNEAEYVDYDPYPQPNGAGYHHQQYRQAPQPRHVDRHLDGQQYGGSPRTSGFRHSVGGGTKAGALLRF